MWNGIFCRFSFYLCEVEKTSVLKSYDEKEVIVSCKCGCDDGIHMEIRHNDGEDFYAIAAFTNGNFYLEQHHPFIEKMKKIWAIIRNKDYYYSDICMSEKDWKQFKEWVNRW